MGTCSHPDLALVRIALDRASRRMLARETRQRCQRKELWPQLRTHCRHTLDWLHIQFTCAASSFSVLKAESWSVNGILGFKDQRKHAENICYIVVLMYIHQICNGQSSSLFARVASRFSGRLSGVPTAERILRRTLANSCASMKNRSIVISKTGNDTTAQTHM